MLLGRLKFKQTVVHHSLYEQEILLQSLASWAKYKQFAFANIYQKMPVTVRHLNKSGKKTVIISSA